MLILSSKPSIASRVRAGVQHLNKQWRNWYWHVDPGTLEMHSDLHCVGGQLSGTYLRFLERMGLTLEDAGRLGFTMWLTEADVSDIHNIKDEFPALTAAWQRAIRHLRAQADQVV